MKVLWVCNTLPGAAAKAAGRHSGNKEGWLDGALMGLLGMENDKCRYCGGLSLAIASPVSDRSYKAAGRMWESVDIGDNGRISLALYGFYEDIVHPEIYDEALEREFTHIIEDFEPDIIHVFGTEYGHTLAVGRVTAALKSRGHRIALLIGIQGIISECARVYMNGLPKSVIYHRTFRDIIRDDGILRQQEKFKKRGEYELEAITYATDITGRTEYDRLWSAAHNPAAAYHHMNETLRREFYDATWDATECDRHVIFMSQGDYPLKGLHLVLDVMRKLKEDYPDIRLVVAGNNITDTSTFIHKLKLSGYGRYINSLIEESGLKDKVVFKGMLNAAAMKREYLSCHTFICASSLENSANSVGEAMIMGVPVVAHRTGGIPSIIGDGSEGLLYDDIEELPDMLKKLWSDDAYATELGAAAINHATVTHNAEDNLNRLMEIYEQID